MTEITPFNKLTFPGRPKLYVKDLGHFLDVNSNIRIHYKPNSDSEKLGFDFYITELHSFEDDDMSGCMYRNPSLVVECLFWGNVSWDGLRHLYMGDKATDTENYLYCVDTKVLSCVFEKLRELEVMFCNVDQL
jgi:hypothetical protein